MRALFCLALTLFTATLTTTVSAQALSEQQVHEFCHEKPIWAAFAIEPSTCMEATKACLQQSEFTDLDSTVLSEEFYNCIFKKLDIEIE